MLADLSNLVNYQFKKKNLKVYFDNFVMHNLPKLNAVSLLELVMMAFRSAIIQISFISSPKAFLLPKVLYPVAWQKANTNVSVALRKSSKGIPAICLCNFNLHYLGQKLIIIY